MNMDRLPRVMLIYRTMIPSIRLCGHAQMRALCDKGEIEYRHFPIRLLDGQDLSWPDIVLLGRLDTRAEEYIVRRLKRMKKYLIYILDDDLLSVPENASSAAHYGTREVKSHIKRMIGLSDAILSPSPLILEKYAQHHRKMTTEEPAIAPASYQRHASDQTVTIGFAGSVDRVSDVECVLREALERIHAEYGSRVRFSFFGGVPSFAQNLDAQVIPYNDSYDEYRRTLNEANWDIGLAPMMDSSFHRYKHYNKFCEYAAAGIVGVFSRKEPYIRLEQTIGIGCFCENTAKSWYNAIAGLLNHPQERESLREQACRYAHEKLSPEHIAEDLLTTYADVFSYRAPACKRPVYLRTIMFRQIAARLLILWQAHGWRMLGYLVHAGFSRIRKRSLPKKPGFNDAKTKECSDGSE